MQYGGRHCKQMKKSVIFLLLFLVLAPTLETAKGLEDPDSIPASERSDFSSGFTFEEFDSSKSSEADGDSWDDLLAPSSICTQLRIYRSSFLQNLQSCRHQFNTSSFIIRAPPGSR